MPAECIKLNVDFAAGGGHNGCMFDTAGSRLNFPVVAGVEETFRVSFWVGGSGMSVLGATFQAACYVAHGDERGELVAVLPVKHDSAENKVLLTVPELEHGHYWWELRATDAAGKECRLLYGTLAALTSAEVARLGDAAEESELRELTVEIGGGYARPLILRWQACSVAASLAADAARAAERAEAAADRAEDAEENVLGKLGAAQAFMESFNKALFEAIRVVDNYLWVGGVNTGHYLRGQDGITPHIGTDGYWYVGTQRLGDRPAFGKDGITPHITPDGFWAFGEMKTTVRAEGRDGLDGTAVRFILVDSYEEIPQSGETCNGGFRYLVRKEGWAVIGEPAATGNGEWEAWEVPAYLLPSEFTHLRVPGVLNANSTPAYLMVRTTGGEVLGVSQNAVTWAVGDVVTWEFAEAVRVPNGAVVQLFLRTTNEGVTGAVPDEGVRLKSLLANVGVCRVRYANVWYGERTPYLLAWGAGASEFYEVYAWVEHDGSAGWVRVDRTNDLATARVYGVMKYGTDMTVVGGAPVGQNAEGQACVPLAGFAVAGTGKLGTAAVLTEGGMVGMNVSGNMMTPVASVNEFGSVRLSTSTPLSPSNSGNIGLGENKGLRAEKASLTAFGTVKLGSQFGASNPEPYLVGIGATSDGRLANNYAFGGALQHRQPDAWQGSMSWLDAQISGHPEYFVDMYYSGLLTTEQFSQSSGSGLELLPATTQRLAGVYLASSMTDSRAAAVLTSDVVVNYLNEHYYEKSVVYTKQETLTQIEYKLQPYATVSWVSDNYMTRSQILAELEKKLGCPSGRAKNIEFLTASERESLSSIDQKTAYLVYAG